MFTFAVKAELRTDLAKQAPKININREAGIETVFCLWCIQF